MVPFGAAAPPGPLFLSRPSTSSGATPPWEAGTERRSAVRQQHGVQLKLECVRERPAWTPQDLPSSLEACLTKNLPMNLMKMKPALAPPTWRARCRVSLHGHREYRIPPFRFGTGREGG